MSPFGSNFHHDSFEWIGPPQKRWDPPTSLNYRSNTNINIDFTGLGNGIKSAAKWNFLGNVLNNITSLGTVWMLSKGNEKGATMVNAGMRIAGSIFGHGFGGGIYGRGIGYGGGYGFNGGQLADYPYTYVDPSLMVLGRGVGFTGVKNNVDPGNNDGKKAGDPGNDDGKKADGTGGTGGKKAGDPGNDDGKKADGTDGTGGKKADGTGGTGGAGNGSANNVDAAVKEQGQNFYNAIKNGSADGTAVNSNKLSKLNISGKVTLGANNNESDLDDKQDTVTNYPNSFTITDVSSGNSNKHVFEFVRLETIDGEQKPIYKLKDEVKSADDSKSGQSNVVNYNVYTKGYEVEYVLESFENGQIKLKDFKASSPMWKRVK